MMINKCDLFALKRMINRFISKEASELKFQKKWVCEFSENKGKVLEYWKLYRYYDEIVRTCSINNNTRVLDVGCGISTILHFIKGKRYGIDPLANIYKQLYSYPPDLHIQQASGENIPFEDNMFNIVFCSNVIDHMSSPIKALDEIQRVLMPNGYFVLTVECFEKDALRNPAHPHSLQKNEVISMVQDKFELIFDKKSRWIGLRNYVKGITPNHHRLELIIIARKNLQ